MLLFDKAFSWGWHKLALATLSLDCQGTSHDALSTSILLSLSFCLQAYHQCIILNAFPRALVLFCFTGSHGLGLWPTPTTSITIY